MIVIFRRTLFVCCLLLTPVACGVLLTVAVAWGCLLWSPAAARQGVQFTGAGHPTTRAMSRHGEFDGYALFEHQGIGWKLDYVIAARSKYHTSSRYNNNRLTRVWAGWPWFCLEGEELTLNAQNTRWALTTLRALPRADATRRSRVPLAPIWPAFIANTAVFATPFALVFAAVVFGRPFYRRLRGRCPHCAYSLRGLEPEQGQLTCPECGHPVGGASRTS